MNTEITSPAEQARRADLLDEARRLTEAGDLEGENLTRFEEIEAEVGKIDERAAKRQKLAELYHAGYVEDGDGAKRVHQINRRDPWTEGNPYEPAGETRSRALTAVERWNASDPLKESATSTLERLDRDDMGGVSDHVLRFSNPLYVSAFRKFARDPESYVASLTAEEGRVWAAAREYQRAALGTSGAVLPSPLDPTVVLTNAGAVDPMRSIARIDTTTAKQKRYITSAGSTFSFDAEVAEVSDDTFTETEVTIVNHKAQGFIQASLEVWADQPGFDTEVARIIADGKARLEADKFANGTGTNQPKGIETALAGGASVVTPTTAEVFAAADLFKTIEALPSRFRPNAVWMAELSTIDKIDQFETAAGAKLFPRVGDANPILLRRVLVENSTVDAHSAINPAVTASNHILYVGDWVNYVICDRVGLSVSFVSPGVLQNTASNLPDGRVGWYAYWRVGADVLTISAFRVLNIATTA